MIIHSVAHGEGRRFWGGGGTGGRTGGDDIPERNEWEEEAANLLKDEIKLRGLTYAQVVEKLAEIGVSEDERNLGNKLSKGRFAAAFMLQCLAAMDSSSLQLQP